MCVCPHYAPSPILLQMCFCGFRENCPDWRYVQQLLDKYVGAGGSAATIANIGLQSFRRQVGDRKCSDSHFIFRESSVQITSQCVNRTLRTDSSLPWSRITSGCIGEFRSAFLTRGCFFMRKLRRLHSFHFDTTMSVMYNIQVFFYIFPRHRTGVNESAKILRRELIRKFHNRVRFTLGTSTIKNQFTEPWRHICA